MSSTINKSIFKAYDVRGRYPEELNEAAVAEIAKALAKNFKKGRIVLGHDVRLSSVSLYEQLQKALIDAGFDLELIGYCTTPMFYFVANEMKAAGVMVTASHAPKEFNGLKIVNDKGDVVSGSEILKWII